MHAGSSPEYAEEFPIARLCDSGLPDPEVCDVLHIPPREAEVVSEAWSRGCAAQTRICLKKSLAQHACMQCMPAAWHPLPEVNLLSASHWCRAALSH